MQKAIEAKTLSNRRHDWARSVACHMDRPASNDKPPREPSVNNL